MVDILQPPAQKSSRNAHSRAEAIHQNHDEQSVFDGENINNSSLAQEIENNELQVTHDFTAETQHYTDIRKRKMIATSRSLSSLTSVPTTTSSNSSSSKRRRISSSSKSPSPPPSAAHVALSHAPQRHPKRAPLGNRHPSTSQQTTLDKFLNGNTKKEHQLLSAVAASQRPTKKARRNSPDDASVSMATDATLNHQQPENRESPDPLNVIPPLSNGDRIRTRQRSTPLTDSAHISPEIVTTRSSQRRAQPVIIADEVSTTKKEDDPGDNKTTGTAPAPEKRSLRSHDGGSRSKSELALYFPNYEQILSLEPVKTEFLSPDTTITILDDLTELPLPAVSLPINSPSRTRRQRKSVEQISPFGNPLVDLQGVERVQLPSDDSPGEVTVDPLGDELYFKAHRRHERQEKQLRNIEKERAQHEKIQLDRLLDELQGHDWLRVMGISGITDTEKKLYEPKRDHFVKEVSALIDKFRIWKEEEKRRKLEREQLQYEAANAAAQKEEQEKYDDEGESEDVEVDEKPSSSDVQSFDSSELDAAAAQQLLQEAISATATAPATGTSISSPPASPSRPQPRRRLVDELTSTPPQSQSHRHQRSTSKLSTTKSHPFPLSPHGSHVDIVEEYDENKPFTSFYRKRHLRDAAFSSSRRGGRNRSAFGQPLPEINEEREFQLPSDVLTPELVLSMERKRRRLKRESRGG